jgi:signal peptide peptidase SppA
MQMNNQQALSRINGREAFVMPETVDSFVSNLTQFARTDPDKAGSLETSARESIEFCYSISSPQSAERKPFIYSDGLAIIPIHGALINRFGGCWGFVTGYQAIRRQMNAALEDEDVKLIVFDVDSPGGETAGCLELADEIRASREIKPSLAVVDSLSASAGYALASAATRMVATPSSKIGSIGVYIMHVDLTGALDQAGIQISYVEAPKGGMKTAGSSYRRLDKKAEQYLQAFVDASYDEFVALIVENRALDDAAIRETEGRVFRADEALALGLIDEVKTPSEAVSTFVAELADDEPSEEEDEEMTTKTPATAAAPAAAAPEVASAPDAAAIQAAVNADRERCAAIKALPEASKLPKLADQLALAGYTVEEATATLKAGVADLPSEPAAPAAGSEAPKPAAAAAPVVDEQNHLETAMAGSKQPEVGAGQGGEGGQGGEKSDAELSQSILADHAAATGRKYEPAK